MVDDSKKFLLIACKVLYRELSYLIALSPHSIEVVWLSQRLHDVGSEEMSKNIQEALDAVPPKKYDAVLLGYALCNNGIENLVCNTKMVVTKAHDCITLLLGSRKRYQDFFNNNAGTYYLSTGWIEKNGVNDFDGCETVNQRLGLDMNMARLIEKYGEENAEYIMETIGDSTKNYKKVAYIKSEYEKDNSLFVDKAKEFAKEKEFEFEKIDGKLSLLKNLLNGNWTNDFLLVEPGNTIKASFDDDIVEPKSRS